MAALPRLEAARARGGRRRLRSIAAAAALAATCAHGGAASAEPPAAAASPSAGPTPEELAAARQLFNEGKEFEKTGEWDKALERFRKVAEVKMTPQVRFHVALCEEHLGRLVSAINGFELAADEARRAGSAAEDVAANAPARAEALRRRVPTLRIEVEGRIVSSRVLLDGAPVAKALLGTDIPVDPGTHVVEVDTGGTIAARQELSLAERAKETVALAIDDPEPTAAPPIAPAPPPDESGTPPPAEAKGGTRIPAIVVGAVGVATLAGAGVLYGLSQRAISDVRATCDENDENCDRRLEGRAEDGRTYNTVANVLLGVGGAAVVTAGVLWFVLGPSKAPSKPAAGAVVSGSAGLHAVRIAPAPGGVLVTGQF